MLSSLITGGWMYLVVAVAAAGAAGWTVHAIDNGTIAQMKADDVNAAVVAANAARTDQSQRDQITELHNELEAKSQAALETNTRTIIERVPTYVTAKADAACVLPNGFVRLLDAAGTGTDPDILPGASSEPDDAPSGIPLSQATALLAENLGNFAKTRQQLIDAEAWAAEQRAKNQ